MREWFGFKKKKIGRNAVGGIWEHLGDVDTQGIEGGQCYTFM